MSTPRVIVFRKNQKSPSIVRHIRNGIAENGGLTLVTVGLEVLYETIRALGSTSELMGNETDVLMFSPIIDPAEANPESESAKVTIYVTMGSRTSVSQPSVMRVGKATPIHNLAIAIAQTLKAEGAVELQPVGLLAACRAVKAASLARGFPGNSNWICRARPDVKDLDETGPKYFIALLIQS